MEKFFSPHRKEMNIFVIFFSVALSIILLHFLFHSVRVFDMTTSIFYMDEKYTLASFFTIVTSFLVGFIALSRELETTSIKEKLISIGYGSFFLLLSFDEYFEVHEYINSVIKSFLSEGSWIKTLSVLSWVFPLFIVILGVFWLFVEKIKLARSDVRKILIGGVLCFALVLLLEVRGGPAYGKKIYLFYVGAEEGLEMIGVSLFLLATLLETRILKNK